jgi:hypothetical protein
VALRRELVPVLALLQEREALHWEALWRSVP